MPVGYIGQQSLCSSTELTGDAKDWDNSIEMLDVGCGAGAFVLHLCERFPNIRVVGIDNDKNAITSASGVAQARGFGNRVNFELRDMDALIFDRNYDAIISVDAIQHSKVPISVLSKLLGSWSRRGPFRVTAWCFSKTEAGRTLACRWGCENALPMVAYEQAKSKKNWPVEIADTTMSFGTRSKHSLESLLEVETPFRHIFGNSAFEERLSLENDTVAAITAGIISQVHIIGERYHSA